VGADEESAAAGGWGEAVAAGESVITCPSTLKDSKIHTVIAVIEHVETNIIA
jgi:hypothetical protein